MLNMNQPFVFRKNVVRTAILAAVGLASTQAGAVVNVAGPTAIKFAKELPITATTTLALTNAGQALDLAMPGIASYAPSNTVPLWIKLHLSNGAKFTTAPSLVCSGAGSGAGATSFTSQITFGGTLNSDVTFRITASNEASAGATISGASAACSATINGITVSGALADVNVSATYEYTNGAVAAVSGISGAYITFLRGFSAVSTEATGNLVVDAINGSTRFSAGGAAASSATGVLGSVHTTAVGGVFSANGAGLISAGDVFTAATLTVNGPAIAAANGANVGSGVYLSNTSDCGSKTWTPSDSAASSVTFNVQTALLTQLSASSGLIICANVSGNASQILTGQITATLSAGTGVANVTADLSAASNNIESITQNGTTKNAYFINASTSTNKTSVIRIVNTGGTSGTIRATAYKMGDGGTGTGLAFVPTASAVAAGTANSVIATLAPNESISLTSAQLEGLMGYVPAAASEKYRVLFSTSLAGFKVLSYTRDVLTGNLTLSQNQDD